VWQYYRATGDDDFCLRVGAEILLDTARFWASRAVAEADGRRHIRHVIGPDEYHEDVDDNAFTNVLARWNIARALEPAELYQRVGPMKPARFDRSWRPANAKRRQARWIGYLNRVELDETRPLACFAGIWNNWTSVRKVREGPTTSSRSS
jgi:trehalose/maltose hydrolase-like predicted phosphorylase